MAVSFSFRIVHVFGPVAGDLGVRSPRRGDIQSMCLGAKTHKC